MTLLFILQELLAAFRVISVRWRSRKLLQIVLSNACIINLVLAGHSGDVEKLLIDRSLVGKLSADTLADGKYEVFIDHSSFGQVFFAFSNS